MITFSAMLLLFIPIGILVDLSEKIDKLNEFDVPLNEIVDYYLNFVWYFGNTLYPIFVFLAVIPTFLCLVLSALLADSSFYD